MKKFIIIIACILLFSMLFTSCASNEEDELTTSDAEESSEPVAESEADDSGYITLFDNGVSHFDLIATMPLSVSAAIDGRPITPEMIPSTVQKKDFRMQLLSIIGLKVNDVNAPRLLTKPNEKSERISVYYGITENPKTQQILDSVQLNEYGYCVDGREIFIYGHTMEELRKAGVKFVSDLIEHKIENDDGAKTFRLPVASKRTFAGEELAIMSVPKPEFGSNRLFCESGPADERLWVVKNCTPEDYNNYVNTLKSASFVEYETNEIEGNLYATYTKNGIIVDAWYTKDGYIRITASKEYDARPLTAISYTSKGKGPALFMLGKAEDNGGGQECLVFRLSDGRFVIVDSAIPYEYGENIMAFLKKEAPDPNNIVIANWMFTHNHGDHVCGFVGLCQRIEQYKDILTIESFTYNFPGPEQAETPYMDTGISQIPNLAEKLFPDAKVYRALPGNTFKFADMEYEILASPESYMYESYPNSTNGVCVFYRVTMGGQIINVTGDTCDWDHVKILELYGDYLQCDILQAPHHGGLGAGSVESSQKYKPKYILFCHSSGEGDRYGWEDVKDEDFNLYLIDPAKNPNYQEHFVMSDYIYYLPLPYSKGNYVRYTWSDYGM